MKKEIKLHKIDQQLSVNEKYKFQGSPHYPKNEDAYSNNEIAAEVDPENTTQKKELRNKTKLSRNNELRFGEAPTGNDLDVPGAELDDEDENIGSEDEENNYYSLGGENHDNLEEDKGD